MKHLMIQSDFRKIQNDFFDQLDTAVNNYYKQRLDMMIKDGLTPKDLKNDIIADISCKFYEHQSKQPF
jgi:hypothetical protein